MTARCYIGNLRIVLDTALEDGSLQGDKDWVLLLALLKVQRSLQSNTPLSPASEVKEVMDCILLKESKCPCTKDLEGLCGNLVFVLAFGNNFTNHAAGKTFLALFNYLSEGTVLFTVVVKFVWKALRACFSDAEDAFLKPEFSNKVVKSLCLQANLRISAFGCKVAMHLLQIVHGLLRKFKRASEFAKCLASSVVRIPELLLAFITCFTCLRDNVIEHKLEEQNLMLAALLRCLCSFNHYMCMHSEEINVANFISKSLYLDSVKAFLAAFSQFCLNVEQSHRLSHYIRHKFLMLMFRLRELFIKSPWLAITCINILKRNIAILCPSLFHKQSQLLDQSMSSPFKPCFLERKITESLPYSPACHPERLAVFLLFKAEASLRKTPWSSILSIKAKPASSGHSTEQGDELWMLKWLLSHVSMVQNVWKLGHNQAADCLASSFLQIFLDEDTLLLEMLLLLQDSFIPELISGSDVDYDSLHEAQKLLEEIFKPLRLFGVFISMISYDHSVILEFLISKDSSILCLQYLMQCMRMVKNTWPEFLFLSHTRCIEHSRKDECRELDMKSTSNEHTFNINQASSCSTWIDIKKVGACLIDLKRAVEKSHKKHEFPYNPSPLLKHLETFEHLWLGASSQQ